jgi:hypothetical protein
MEKARTSDKPFAAGMDLSGRDSTYYNDIIGTNLFFNCSSWDSEALKCWGENFASLNVRRIIEKVTVQRKTGYPRFQVRFPEKKNTRKYLYLIWTT